jgi:ribosome-binding factor A
MATTWCVSVKDEYGETIAADEWITGGAPRNPELAAAHRVSMVHLPDDSSHRHMYVATLGKKKKKEKKNEKLARESRSRFSQKKKKKKTHHPSR